MKEGWKYEKLGDLCAIERGGSPRPITEYITEDPNGINWIKIGDAIEGSRYISSTAEKIKPEGMKKSRFVQKGDFILSNSMSFGKPYILQVDGCIHDGWLVIHDTNNIFNKDFLYYYLSSSTTYRKFQMMAVGGVVNNLNSKIVRNVDVAVLPLSEQQQIVEELDLLSGIIEKKKEQLKELDNLAQSIFYEMFGDPVANEKGWETKFITEIVSNKKNSLKRGPFGGALKKDIFVDQGYLVYEQYHALNNDFSYARYFISAEKYQEMIDFAVKAGDILISCSGVNLGRMAIVPENSPNGIINQALLKITLDNLKYENVMFQYVFTNERFKEVYFGYSRGCAIPNMPPMSEFKKIPYICPPLPLQQSFASKIEAIEKQKALIKQSITETETLFNSRMDYYFG